MDCERNDSDDDEELEALRLAALATLKSRTANDRKVSSFLHLLPSLISIKLLYVFATNINAINSCISLHKVRQI